MNEGATRAGAGLVNGGGDERFAGPGLAADEHGGIRARHEVNPLHDLADRRRRADDVVMRAFGRDRLLQVGVFLFQPVAQGGNLCHRLAQLAFIFLAFGDVAKDHDGPGEDILIVDRGRDIFDTDRFPSLRQNTSSSMRLTSSKRKD